MFRRTSESSRCTPRSSSSASKADTVETSGLVIFDVDYIVQSVPSRRGVRERLLAQLPLAVVVEDTEAEPRSPWRGYRACLKEIKSTHAVIVQDDARVCRNFEQGVERIIEHYPNNPVVLFYPGLPMRSRRMQQSAAMKKQPFFLLNRHDFLPVVAVLWPKEKAEELLAWSQGRSIPGLRPPYRSDDAVAGSWMRHTKQDIYVVFPSIVQHDDDVPPVKGGHHKAGFGRNKGRVALAFCEDDPLEWLNAQRLP